MIKILHTSDWHIDQLGKWTSKRSKENENLTEMSGYHISKLNELVDKAIKDNVNFFVFGGDLFHNSLSNHKEKDVIFKELVKMINRLKEKKIYVIFLSGNHDITRRITEKSKTNSLELLYNINYDDYLYVNEPESSKLSYKDYKVNGEDVRFILFPYLRGDNTKDDIYEQLSEITDTEKTKILVGHLDIFGALYNGIELQSLDLTDTNTWHPDELEDLNVDLILLGHVHNHQVLGAEESIIYCGSPYKLSFNEEDTEKGYYIHTITEEEISSEFKELKSKKWKTFELDLASEVFEDLVKNIEKEELSDAIVRIKIKNIEIEDYKYIPYKEINEILKSKQVFLFRGYSYNERRSDMKKEEVDQEEFLDNLSKEINPHYILEKILKEDKKSKKFIEESIKELDLLMSNEE